MSTAPLPQGRPPGRARRRSNLFTTVAAAEQGGGYSNANLFRPTCTPDRFFYAKDDHGEDTVTTFRLLPEFAEDGSWYPARELDDAGMLTFSGWINAYLYCKLPGGENRSGGGFIVYDADDPAVDANKARWANPAWRLIDGINKAQKADKGAVYWGRLLLGDNGFKRPNWNYFAYALMYGRGGGERYEPAKGLRPEDRKPIVLQMGIQVGQGIEQMIKLPRAGYEDIDNGYFPAGVAFEDLFVAADPVDLKRGLLFRGTQMHAKDPRPAERARAKARAEAKGKRPPWFLDVPVDPDSERKPAGYGYEIYTTDRAILLGKARDDKDMAVRPAIPEEYWEKLARKHAMPVRDHLLFPDQARQLELMIAAIRKPSGDYAGDLFRHVFGDNPEESHVVESCLAHVEARTATFDLMSRDDRRGVRNGDPAAGAQSPATTPDRPAPTPTPDVDDDDDDDDDVTTATPAAPAATGPSRQAAMMAAGDGDDADDDDDEDLGDDDLDDSGRDHLDDDLDEEAAATSTPGGSPDPDDDGNDDRDEEDPAAVVPATVAREEAARLSARPVGRDGQPLVSRNSTIDPADEPPAPRRAPVAAPAVSTPPPPRSGQEALRALREKRLGSPT